MQLAAATLNLRNLADRWDERLPLLLADTAALQPDLLGLQEVVYPLQQDRILGAAGAGRYHAVRGWAGRPEYGNSLLVRSPLVGDLVERLDLGLGRSALRSAVATGNGTAVDVVVTHLHHPPDAHAERVEQVGRLVEWLSAHGGDDVHARPAQIVMGDFNADPREPAYAAMVAAGYRSAHVEATGAEPRITWPSGLQAPAIDTDGEPDCLDYIWVRGPIRVRSCRLVYDRPSATDPTLYPSDHLGLVAELEIA